MSLYPVMFLFESCWIGLHVDHVGVMFLAMFEFSMHLTPRAPLTETRGADVLTQGALNAISLSYGDPHSQSSRGHTQGQPTGRGYGRAEDVTQWKTPIFTKTIRYGAGHAGTAPEPIATGAHVVTAVEEAAVPVGQILCHV